MLEEVGKVNFWISFKWIISDLFYDYTIDDEESREIIIRTSPPSPLFQEYLNSDDIDDAVERNVMKETTKKKKKKKKCKQSVGKDGNEEFECRGSTIVDSVVKEEADETLWGFR